MSPKAITALSFELIWWAEPLPFIKVRIQTFAQDQSLMHAPTTAMLVLVAIVLMAAIVVFRRWVSTPQRKIAKLFRQIEAGQMPEMPVRTDFDHEIALLSEGFTIIALKSPSAEIVTVRWDTVVDATAYKRDLWSTDQVCIAFELSDGTFVEAHEEMKGWSDLCSAMPEHLPGAPRWEQWFMNITTPAFEPNITPLFHRAPTSIAP